MTRGRFGLHRDYDKLVSGKRVLVVDDVVNAGLSVRQTADAVKEAGGNVSRPPAWSIAATWTRPGSGLPEYAYLLEYDIPNWPAAECPQCQRGVPVNTESAHGQDFLDAQHAGQA